MQLGNDRTLRDEREKLALDGERKRDDEGQENGHLKHQKEENLYHAHKLSVYSLLNRRIGDTMLGRNSGSSVRLQPPPGRPVVGTNRDKG